MQDIPTAQDNLVQRIDHIEATLASLQHRAHDSSSTDAVARQMVDDLERSLRDRPHNFVTPDQLQKALAEQRDQVILPAVADVVREVRQALTDDTGDRIEAAHSRLAEKLDASIAKVSTDARMGRATARASAEAAWKLLVDSANAWGQGTAPGSAEHAARAAEKAVDDTLKRADRRYGLVKTDTPYHDPSSPGSILLAMAAAANIEDPEAAVHRIHREAVLRISDAVRSAAAAKEQGGHLADAAAALRTGQIPPDLPGELRAAVMTLRAAGSEVPLASIIDEVTRATLRGMERLDGVQRMQPRWKAVATLARHKALHRIAGQAAGAARSTEERAKWTEVERAAFEELTAAKREYRSRYQRKTDRE